MYKLEFDFDSVDQKKFVESCIAKLSKKARGKYSIDGNTIVMENVSEKNAMKLFKTFKKYDLDMRLLNEDGKLICNDLLLLLEGAVERTEVVMSLSSFDSDITSTLDKLSKSRNQYLVEINSHIRKHFSDSVADQYVADMGGVLDTMIENLRSLKEKNDTYKASLEAAIEGGTSVNIPNDMMKMNDMSMMDDDIAEIEDEEVEIIDEPVEPVEKDDEEIDGFDDDMFKDDGKRSNFIRKRR